MSKTLAFTGQDLVANFDAIDRWITGADANIHGLVKNEGQIVETLQMLTDYVQRIEGRVQALENIKLVVRAPRGSKLFLFAVCGASFYAGRRWVDWRKIVLEEKSKANEEYLKSQVDHPAGRKINGDKKAATDNPEKN